MIGTLLLVGTLLSVSPGVGLIPRPAAMKVTGGAEFVFTANTKVEDPGRSNAAGFLQEMFKRAAGFDLGSKGKGNKVLFQRIETFAAMPNDWYRMTVTKSQVTVQYTADSGAFYA